MTFPRRERRSGCGVVGSQISNHRRLKCTLRRHCCVGFSLASSFYVYAPACCVVALPGLFNSQAHRAQEWCSPKLSLLLTFVTQVASGADHLPQLAAADRTPGSLLLKLLRPAGVDHGAIGGAGVHPGHHQPGAEPILSTGIRDDWNSGQTPSETPSGADRGEREDEASWTRSRGSGGRHGVPAHWLKKQSQVSLHRIYTQNHCNRSETQVNELCVSSLDLCVTFAV